MTTVVAPLPVAPPRPRTGPPSAAEPRVLLRNISWQTYEALLRDLVNSHLRLTYDQGNLEIMSPSPQHAKIGKVLARMVETLTMELDIPLVALAKTTWKHEALAKGCEADECYYIPRADWATGRETFDLTVDPPPDLAIEVDVTSSSIDKLAIYAALKVPEVWRYQEPSLIVLHL